MKKLAKRRPTEATSLVAGALAALLAPRLGFHSPSDVAALSVVLGGLPAAATFVVGLIRGKRA